MLLTWTGIFSVLSCLEGCQLCCSILFKNRSFFFFISLTISTLIARNNYISTKPQSCFCYHHNHSIIFNYWRLLTVRLKNVNKRESTCKELDRGKIPWRSQVSLQNDVVMSGEFFHWFLYQFTVSNFFLV